MNHIQVSTKFILCITLLVLAGCASHRKKANCSEIRYRLDHVQYSEDQHDWIEGEWKECMSEYDSLAKVDSVQYQGIYHQFADSLHILPDSTAHKATPRDSTSKSITEGTP